MSYLRYEDAGLPSACHFALNQLYVKVASEQRTYTASQNRLHVYAREHESDEDLSNRAHEREA